MFFCTEDYPLAVFAIVNGGLYYLFLEFSLLDGCDPEYEGYYILCRSNFERALGSFHLLMAPTKENVEALVLGVNNSPPRLLNFTLPSKLTAARLYMLSIYQNHLFVGR